MPHTSCARRRLRPPSKWRNLEQIGAVFQTLPNTVVTLPRLFDAYDAVIAINREGILGDIVECGVWNGGCAGLMGIANLRNPGPSRRLHLLNSFEGLPPPAPKLKRPGSCAEWAPIAIGACVGISKNEVERFLVSRLGLDQCSLIFHEGWFQYTVPAAKIERIALLRLDGDLYNSTKVCLEHLFSKVSDGGYVIIDDYGDFPGCKRATDEFFAGIGITPVWIWSDCFCVYFRK